jgi:dTDP-4-dehydrorhamnose reductase
VNIVVLGSTGMLGRHVVDAFQHPKYNILEINRSGHSYGVNSKILKIDFENESLMSYGANFKEMNIDFFINCAGATRQKILSSKNAEMFALKLNSILPLELGEVCRITGANLINIATDCVFNGVDGNYFEDVSKSPVDLYGESKLLGEIQTSDFMNLRASFIGKHPFDSSGLMEWIFSHQPGSTIKGYTNHFWNGITAMHFAKVIRSVIENNFYEIGTFHLVPSDVVSKYQLLKTILDLNTAKNIFVEPISHSSTLNMTLKTLNVQKNADIWSSLGYGSVPTIKDLLIDYFIEYKN